MHNPFRKQPTKEQKKEAQRRWAIIKEQIYPLLLAETKSINEMKQRIDSTLQAIKNEMVIKVESYKHSLETEPLGQWDVKPLAGKGTEIEQKILDILAEEKMIIVDELLTHLPRIIDTFIYEEMGKREPKSLEVKFP